MTRTERVRVGAFTLLELMVGIAIGSFLLTAVLGTSLYLLRSEVLLSEYVQMDGQIRRGMELLGNDLRAATDVTWKSSTDITLTIPDVNGGTSQVTYAWNATVGGFFRVPGSSSSATTGRRILITDMPALASGGAGMSFLRFDVNGVAATTDASTKRIQIRITVQRKSNVALPVASSSGSCSFILRNKLSS